MTIRQFIEAAIIDGFPAEMREDMDGHITCVVLDSFGKKVVCPLDIAIRFVVMNPEAWKAVGKVKGWDENLVICSNCGVFGREETMRLTETCMNCGCKYEGLVRTISTIKAKMYGMVDALIEGKTLEEYIATL